MKVPSEESLVKIVEREGISAVWLVPIIALIFGAWLVFDAVSQRGTFITVQFDNVSGIVPGKTEVRYKGLTAGIVKAVEPSDDLQSVIVEIEMVANTKPYLTDKATFWYVTADISLKGISDIDTLLSGSYINIHPDIKEEGDSKRHFVALHEPPELEDSVPGLHIKLTAERLGSLAKHSPVTFRQITVGYVYSYRYIAVTNKVEISAVIEPEYKHLVRENSRFWNASGLEVSASLTSGVKVRANSLASIVSGGIAFDHPDYEPETNWVKSGTEYTLHGDFDSAEMGHEIELMLPWDSGINVGATIIYQGLTLGRISSFIDINPQARYVQAKAHINPRVKPYLTEESEFFVVAPKINLGGIQNMAQIIKGTHIGVRPSTTGKLASSFQVYSHKPAYKYDEPGLHLILSAQDIASISPGINVYYKQQVVGNVQAVDAQGAGEFMVHIFIKPEFQHFVAQDSRFWNVSGLKVSGSLQGVEINAQSMQSVLMGGIAFDNGLGEADKPKNGDKFQLFFDQETAKQRIMVDVHVNSTKGLSTKTRLMYRGEKIGNVHKIVTKEQDHILQVGLLPQYQDVLRKGSQFWLVNSTLSLSGLADTDALFGGAYINVNAGEGDVETEFWASDKPPAKPLSAKGLQLSLLATSGSVANVGSPINYRGIVVGQVDNISLSASADKVNINVTIEDEYRHLVSADSRFYNSSGVTVRGGLSDFVVKTESIDAIVRGGISFYNPEVKPDSEQTAIAVNEGDHFNLYDDLVQAQSAGILITIQFDDMQGIHQHTKVKFQDQQIGVVERVSINKQNVGLTATVRLNEYGEKFAVAGTQFWLAEADLGLVGSENLDALVGGAAIKLKPGKGELQTHFNALNMAPVNDALVHGLNLTLVAQRLGSIRVGQAVLYRQVEVGKVIGIDLANTADKVYIYINIDQRYAALVSPESKFWDVSGVSIEAGLFSGVELKAESIESILSGAVEFFTPEPAQEQPLSPVEQSHRFILHNEMEQEWLQWQPKIAIGQ